MVSVVVAFDVTNEDDELAILVVIIAVVAVNLRCGTVNVDAVKLYSNTVVIGTVDIDTKEVVVSDESVVVSGRLRRVLSVMFNSAKESTSFGSKLTVAGISCSINPQCNKNILN